MSLVLYDVPTLYFEAEKEDDLRKFVGAFAGGIAGSVYGEQAMESVLKLAKN